MWMITGKAEDEKYNSLLGVYKDLDKAQAYLSSELINDYFSTPVSTEILEIPATDYPVFVIWDFKENKYTYTDLETLSHRLLYMEKVDDEDEQYFILDILSEDYQAIHPGEEYFKFINHIHVENGTIENFIKTGIEVSALHGIKGNFRCDECHRVSSGTLTKQGYAPPQGWRIIEENDEGELYLNVYCSDSCKLSYDKRSSEIE